MNNAHGRSMMYVFIAAILWSTGGVLIKLIDWNPLAIAGTRSGISAILMILYLRKPVKLTKGKMLGALMYAGTVCLFVISNKLTTAANTILLQYSAPIWVALFSGWLLKRKVTRLDWITIFAVMGGMVLFFVGDLQVGQMTGNILAVISGVCFAFVFMTMEAVETDSPAEIPLLGNMLMFLVSLPFMFGEAPSAKSMLGIFLLGVFQLGLSYILVSIASRHITSLESVLISIIEPLLNPIWVLIFIGEAPGGFAVIGGAIVVSAVVIRGVILSRRERRFRSVAGL